MVRVAYEFPEGALSSLRHDPATFASELRIAAAVKWYELRKISQDGRPKSPAFPAPTSSGALGRYGVLPLSRPPKTS